MGGCVKLNQYSEQQKETGDNDETMRIQADKIKVKNQGRGALKKTRVSNTR